MAFGKLGAGGRGFGKGGSGVLGRPSVPLQIVATGGMTLGQSTTGQAGGPPNNYTRDDSRHVIKTGPQSVSELRLAYVNWYFLPSSSLVEISNPNDITVDGAIEYSSSAWNATFSGAGTKTLAGADNLLISDAIPGLTIPAATQFHMRSSLSVASGNSWPVGRVRQTALNENNVFSTNASSQTNGTGALSTTGGVSNPFGYAPIAVIGRPARRHVAVVVFGDSIADAQSYDVSSGDGNANLGHIARGLYAAGVPFVKVTRPSMRLYGMDPDNSPRAWQIASYATHALIQHGVNDLGQASAGEYTLAAMQTRYLKYYAKARALGLKVYQHKITPRTTSTDNWLTSGNQTIVSRFGVGEDRDTLNSWFDTQVSAGTLDGVVDVNSVFEDASNPGKWVTNGTTAFFRTQDGTHPSGSQGGFAAAASTIQTWAASLTV